jgi:hypothetical protein
VRAHGQGQLPGRVILEKWPEGGETMEFRLVLRGHLPPDKRGTVPVKHRIRQELHPQMRTLWQQHPTLRGSFDPDKRKGGLSRVEELANIYKVCDFRFVPLVKKKDFACELDILLLRRQEPFRAFDPVGDLDGRVKTLIDGLRMPQNGQEIGENTPAEDEDPFFCLMDDDSAIFNFRVNVDRLLVPPEPQEPERDIVAIIGVRVTTFGGNQIGYMTAEF